MKSFWPAKLELETKYVYTPPYSLHHDTKHTLQTNTAQGESQMGATKGTVCQGSNLPQ